MEHFLYFNSFPRIHKTDSATPSNKPVATFDPIEGRSRELPAHRENYDLSIISAAIN
jgi:hypothetical protein